MSIHCPNCKTGIMFSATDRNTIRKGFIVDNYSWKCFDPNTGGCGTTAKGPEIVINAANLRFKKKK